MCIRDRLIHPDENRNNAILQYTNEVTINAKRGTIYDRTMQKLAVSTTVQTVFISPSDIKDDAQAELIINGLNEILGVEKDYIKISYAGTDSLYVPAKMCIRDRLIVLYSLFSGADSAVL